MAVKFNVIVDVSSIPDASWDAWLNMGYNNPLVYLKRTYGATEVAERFRKQQLWREVRFRSRRKYMEFCLKWL